MPTDPRPDRSAPTDPDVDLHGREQRAELRGRLATLPLIALGGVIGACLRYAAELTWPPGQGLPWTTLVVNVAGSLLLGLVMVAVTERGEHHPWWRPFLGVGLLGGFTTFSTYAVQVQQSLDDAPGPAMAYLVITPLTTLMAVTVAVLTARAVFCPSAHEGTAERGSR